MELVLPSSNWSSTLTIQLGLCKCRMDNLLLSEGQKLHHQIMLMPPFSEHVSLEEACNSDTPVQNTDYFTFFLSSTPFPHASDHPASLSCKYPKPLTFREADLRLVLPSPRLAVLWINPFSAADFHVSVFGLLRSGANKPGSVIVW